MGAWHQHAQLTYFADRTQQGKNVRDAEVPMGSTTGSSINTDAQEQRKNTEKKETGGYC
eukprot:m.36931 g.36931  ORF g.36931 m.36931 type:complete len:59 (-) comp44870_c0_seq3:26-202(-)